MRNEKKKPVIKKKVAKTIWEEVFVIGIMGVIGSGKSELAVCLEKILDAQFKDEVSLIVPFSKALKDFAFQLGWDGNKDEKGRRLLQLLGTEVARECISENYWVDLWNDRVQEEYLNWHGPRLIIIVDDVRFKNEYEFIKSNGGKIISVRGRSAPQGEYLKHSSERQEGLPVDFVIDNDGTLDKLESQARTILPELIPCPQPPESKIDKVDSSNYVELAIRTESKPDGGDFIRGSDRITRLVHAGLGLCTETGELQDLIKKTLFYDAAFTQAHIIEELGDVLWYVAIAADALGVSMDEIMKVNIDKLKVRYPEKFTKEKALNRDLEKEKEVLHAGCHAGMGPGPARDVEEKHPRGQHWSCPPSLELLSEKVDPCIGCDMSFSEGCAGCVNYKED